MFGHPQSAPENRPLVFKEQTHSTPDCGRRLWTTLINIKWPNSNFF